MANENNTQVPKDRKYDVVTPRLGYSIQTVRETKAPYEGTEYVDETKNQYGKKNGTVTFKRKLSEHLGFGKSEDNNYNKSKFNQQDYDNAVKAEENYRKLHDGHSRIGSILRDGYKEPEKKQEEADYEKEAKRED